MSGLALEHDPEKCAAVFRKDHAQRETESTSLENALVKFRGGVLQLLSTFARCLPEPVEFR